MKTQKHMVKHKNEQTKTNLKSKKTSVTKTRIFCSFIHQIKYIRYLKSYFIDCLPLIYSQQFKQKCLLIHTEWMHFRGKTAIKLNVPLHIQQFNN